MNFDKGLSSQQDCVSKLIAGNQSTFTRNTLPTRYENNSFSLQIPHDWVIIDEGKICKDDPEMVMIVPKELEDNDELPVTVEVFAYSDDFYVPIEKIFSDYQFGSQDCSTINDNYNLSGMRACERTKNNESGSGLMIVSRDKTTHIIYSAAKPYDDKYTEAAKGIISSVELEKTYED